MLRDIERISILLHERPKKSETNVLELVQVVCALSVRTHTHAHTRRLAYRRPGGEL